MEDDVLWAEQHDKYNTDSKNKATRCMMTWWHMNRHNRYSVKMIIVVAENMLILMRLICGFDSRGLIGPRNRCVLYMGVTYTRPYKAVYISGKKINFNKKNVFHLFCACTPYTNIWNWIALFRIGIDKFHVELELNKWNWVELELTNWNWSLVCLWSFDPIFIC